MHRPTIHRSTAVVALGVLALLPLMNMPGELISPVGGFGGSGVGGPDYTAEYEHGWPWVFLYRSFDYTFPATPPYVLPFAPKYGVPWLSWWSWEFWHGDEWQVRVGALVLNLVFGALLLLAVAGAWEWRRRQRSRVLQFTLAECLAAFVLVAAPLGWWWHAKNVAAREAEVEDALGDSAQCYENYHGPLWVKRFIGEDLTSNVFSRVESVSLDAVDGDTFEKALPSLREFRYLRELELNVDPDAKTPIPFSKLAELKGVRSLVLDEIVLTYQDVADELATVRQLESIVITNWRGQDSDIIQRLIGAMPKCYIGEEPISTPSDAHEWPPY